MNAPTELAKVIASQPHVVLGYKDFSLGSFGFRRDEYFAHITWHTRDGRPMSHTLDAGNFLRALMRDVAWGFFYGWVNFDEVFGTVNHYTSVDLYAGSFNGSMKAAGVDCLENFPTDQIRTTFEALLDDWTNAGFDPFAAPQETGSPYGRKNGSNTAKITRARELAKRCVGLKDDLALRSDERGAPINRAFADVPQDQPELHPEPGFENEVHAFNLFAFLSRSQVTWNPPAVPLLPVPQSRPPMMVGAQVVQHQLRADAVGVRCDPSPVVPARGAHAVSLSSKLMYSSAWFAASCSGRAIWVVKADSRPVKLLVCALSLRSCLSSQQPCAIVQFRSGCGHQWLAAMRPKSRDQFLA